eukprot:TRINITY_DN14482_c0_g1_i2.p1 TRINITY_DN14482_c0_g1~~TRINITY_DN14482_c0_g1_i2.p1  ORF type:complete len:106 (-),score=22.13 TRINITY_DN14482_c0_g1_i2:76-393(-)
MQDRLRNLLNDFSLLRLTAADSGGVVADGATADGGGDADADTNTIWEKAKGLQMRAAGQVLYGLGAKDGRVDRGARSGCKKSGRHLVDVIAREVDSWLARPEKVA